ncbi:3'-5' exonuclease [Geopseudomonas aromaticivorans]
MTAATAFPIDRLAEIQARPDDFKLLERVPFTRSDVSFPLRLSPQAGREYNLAVIDVETSGLDHDTDKIIELGIVTARFSLETGRITEITGAHSFYEDPGFPLSEEITRITGITDEMVAGQHIDDALVASLLPKGTLIIAHNAAFDRRFFESRVQAGAHPDLQQVLSAPWLCSIAEIPWADMGFTSRSLESLLTQHGHFYTAHRASIDALATAFLLHTNNEAFTHLIASGQAKSFTVKAVGSPFDAKDQLKARGYAWDDGTKNGPKCWWISVKAEDLDAEKAFLDGLYFKGGERAVITEKTARTRYKAN